MRIVRDGALFSLVASTYLLVVPRFNPRIFLRHYAKEIRQVDWLIVCWFKPRWVILPGTEHIVIPNPYLHHLKGFLVGTVGLAIVSFSIAALLSIQF